MKKQLQSISSFINQKLAVLVLMGCIGVYQTNAQVTLTATAGTTAPTIYKTVNAALAAISAGTHQGDIIITVTANTTEPAPNQLVASGSGSASYSSVIIKPLGNVVVNSAASPTMGRGILEFIGADNITIDGDDPFTPGSRNLTFQVVNSTAGGIGTSALRFSSSAAAGGTGCRNVVIKNCILIGGRNSATSGTLGFCITASGQTNGAILNATTQASDNDNWLVENNEFKRALYGFHAYGHSTNVMDSLVIRNNKFGNDSSDINIGLCGIYLGYTALTANVGSAIIEGNDIQGGDYTTGWSSNVSGVNLAPGNSGAILRNNYIHDIAQPALGSGAYGVIISETTLNDAINIYNNIIKDITAFHTSSIPTSSVNCGIYCAKGTTNLRLNHNTIVLNKPNAGAGPDNFSSCIFLNNAVLTLNEFRNNILVNNQSDAAGQACLNVYLDTVAIFTNSGQVDRNSYWVSGVSRTLGATRATSFLTLADWKTATTKDTNSFYTNPPFISIVNNLRLQAGVKSPLESNGAATFVTTDIDGNARPGPAGSINGGGTLPDIGAHEADMLPYLFSADSVKTTQVIQNVIPGDTSKAIMNIQVYVSGSLGSPLTLNSLLLNTAGTTNSANLTEAKVFYTGSSKTYSTNELYGSVSSPSGSFTVTGSKLLKEGVNNFWVAYSISALATSGNLADVRVDTLSIGSIRLVPANGNPSGSITILNPMTYISSEVTQSTISSVYLKETNREVIGLRVIMSSTGGPALVSSININLNGTTDTADISNIKIWYTGNNKTFATTSQFGATVPFAPAIAAPFGFSLAGLQSVLNDTNYFWVTFDIKGTATALNVIDAEITQLTVAGTSQIPAVTTAFGNRTIRLPYCAAEPTFGGNTDIGRVQLLDELNNAIFSNGSAQPIINNPAATGTYSNFTNLPPANLLRSSTYSIAVDQIISGGVFFEAGLTVYVDWNDDGDFLDAGEAVYILPNRTGPTGTTDVTSLQGSFRVPCNAVLGNVRMRVILEEFGSATASCGTSFFAGEVEDYVINIVDNPIVFKHIGTQQQTGVVAVGATNRPIMRIPVRVDGCGTAVLTQVKMSTTGSTSVANIVSAKLYRTVGNTFNTTDLRQTIPSPSGSFTFTLTDTLAITNDTINYWLAYDVSTSAVVNNLLDAVLDSMEILGSYRVPANGNPSGSITISNPMTYISSEVTQSTISNVYLNETNREVIGLRVIMSSAGAPALVSSININLNGTTDTADISNIKIWYTGNNKTFATTSQFGATVPFAPAIAAPFGFSLAGLQSVLNDTNYFWVTFDIKGTATALNVIDAEITQLTVAGTSQIPAVTTAFGNRTIRLPYCAAEPTFGGNTDIGRVQLLDELNNAIFSNGSAQPIINNPAATGTYSNFTNLPPANLLRSSTYSIAVDQIISGGVFFEAGLTVYVDWNDDGDFLDAGEAVYILPNRTGPTGTTDVTSLQGSFRVPCNAVLGNVRMRVILEEFGSATASCGTSFFAGEVEDYVINIVDNPIVFKHIGTQQQTGVVAVGATNRPIMRIPVRVDGCGTAVLTQVKMSTTGSTSVANIVSAKLYRTVGNTFNTTDLRQTIPSPSGSFTFTLTDTLAITNDTINYWLAYDVSTSAVVNNLLDAVLDSMEILGSYRVPANGNPSGSITILNPMTFVSATTTQIDVSRVAQNSTDNNIISIEVLTSATGAPIDATQFTVNLNGTPDTANISNIKIWYTGSSNTFAANTQFGATVPFAPATTAPFSLTISGNQGLVNGTNYFWLTYDIKQFATLGGIVDGECTGLTIDGTPQIPIVTAPSGNREIRPPYCSSSASFNFDSEILNVTIGSLNNTSNCSIAAPGAGSSLRQYSNFTILPAPNLVSGSTVPFSVHTATCNSNTSGMLGIWIDFNQNGSFLDAGEQVYMSATPFGLGFFATGNITIPCGSSIGRTGMRVIISETNTSILPCGTYFVGETEDYMVNILPGSLVFNSVGAVQQTGAVDKGTLDVPITRIPLRVDGCDSAVLTEIRMSTTGTTNASDISSAKLYRTINSTFNTADLLQTVSSPSGQFTFVLTDTLLVQNDTINYWLAYDVSTSASYGNFIDATLDSINVLGTYRLPANGNPFGKVQIAPPMTFVSATSTQAARNKVIKGTINNQIIGMQVVMSDTGSTSGLTQINFNLDGTVDTADIENIRVWYTGNSNVFATTTQFGTTVPFAPATSYPFAITLTGTQLLRNGTNYFWVTYDIKKTATTTNIVDAEFTGLIVSGGTQTPTITAPIGFREIMDPYCIPTLLGCAGDFISQVTTIGAAVNINNATSCNGNINGYIQYENITPAATIGATFTVQVRADGRTNGLGIWIDYNNDGIFSSSEFVFSAAPSLSTLQTGTITIPVTATVGLTRMRVRAMFNYTPLAADACLPINWGETEDYNFNILPLPPPTTYTWNQTSPASYTVGSNWTPARNTLYVNDILVFNTGSSITVTNVPTQTISKLVVNNNTRVTLNTTSIANLTIADSLNLISGTIVAGTNITPIVGRSATATGVITGAGGVEGNLTRWIAAATRSYTFPLVKGANRRSATINYTTAPTGGELNLSYVNGAPFTGGLPLVDGALLLDSISKDGIWRLSYPTLLSPGTFNITINADNIGGVTNYATTALVSRSNPIAPWTAFGAQVITSGSNTAMVLSRTGLTLSNIEIGIAGTSVNPLPVSLTSFTGTATGIDGILNWSTSTETNNQGFQVERSKDGRSFESTGYFVKGVGNSRIVKNYSLLDVNAFAKADVIYYRLKQVDVDGKFTYSQVIKVSTLASAVKGLLAFPNPYNSSYNVVFNAATEGTAIIEMTDIQGRIITRQTSVVTIGENEIPVNNASAVNAGFYFVRLTKDGETTVIKLVKN